ncbi:MAG: RNB domain-containing ribonuclease [Actinophytocola sp.]|nr:RNB domain-containing ribonuclease [Actinophytocola sp.]
MAPSCHLRSRATSPIPAGGAGIVRGVDDAPADKSAASWDFAAVRAEFDLPEGFAQSVLAEAEETATNARELAGDRDDATDLPFVTIDPPGAKDLDQALLVERRPGGGYRVSYAIADLGAFVIPDGAIDNDARRRGQTLYLPDGNIPLHPPLLSEGAASLLPGETRPAVLWRIDTDSDGQPTSVDVRRALVRSIERFDYEGVQAALERGTSHPSIEVLADFGRLRRARAVERGALELQLPEQQITCGARGDWSLALRLRTEVDAWNAEISLLTGMCAARMMLAAGVGVVRTLPDADSEELRRLRRSATTLGIEWPAGTSVAELLAGLDPDRPESLALYTDSTRLLRGAGYTAFDGGAPEGATHAGIGGPYAHVTAPIRRLVDRFATEVCLAVNSDSPVPEWTRAALADLPSLMGISDTLAAKVERACLDQVEAWVLAERIGQWFQAVVLRADETKAEVLLTDPPVLAKCAGAGMPEGGHVTLKLLDVDVAARTVSFERVTG